ncbi:MAG: pyridoxal phosphate-dependent aminotransferase [Haloquadratum sp.]|jgi:aspartate aminotransferase|nr:pyridoxal phosphate-dependent aminotransferase [Haloferacaceae archaeon]MDR9445485.1 pyridoxal phosphate-dependent aminotransferase [Haloquadratum sp.]
MSLELAARVDRVEPSATLALGNAANALRAEGVDVVDLSVGEPDFPTPQPIVDAAKAALDAGHTGYTTSAGIMPLRAAIVDKLATDGIEATPEEIIVTPGGKQALYEIFQAYIDDGDEVVLLDPAWVSYEAMAKLAGADLTRVDTAPYDFQLAPALDDLAAAVSDATKLLVLNSPSNPTGAVYSAEALAGVRDLAVEHDFMVLSDEIYDRITYDAEVTSMGAVAGMADRTITLNGFSKAYAMTGWRLGYVHAPTGIIDAAKKVHSHSVSCAVNFVQHAGVTALTETDAAVEEMRAAFEHRRDLLAGWFDELGVDVPIGDGAFYMMVPVAPDDAAWCTTAIEEAHVAMVPGSAFGAPGYARLSYAASAERLREGLDRLVDADLL